MNVEKLADILEALKGDKPASQLAKEIGISAQMLRLYLKGTGGIPGTENLQAIADYMGIGLGELTARLGNGELPRACEPSATYSVFTANDAYKICVHGLPRKEKLKLAKIIMNEAV
jgi:transcriptional regulator with XRE-family HTH domain